jgi:hypothetical protein
MAAAKKPAAKKTASDFDEIIKKGNGIDRNTSNQTQLVLTVRQIVKEERMRP